MPSAMPICVGTTKAIVVARAVSENQPQWRVALKGLGFSPAEKNPIAGGFSR